MYPVWDFNTGDDGFVYNGTGYGARQGTDDRGHLDATVDGTEAGTWSTTFTPDASGSHILEFSFWMYQRAGYRIGEYSELKVDVSGGGLAPGEAEYSFRLDGDGGSGQGTGWKTVRVQVDNLEAGQEYTLAFGGSSNAPTSGELTKFRIDDVSLSYVTGSAPSTYPDEQRLKWDFNTGDDGFVYNGTGYGARQGTDDRGHLDATVDGTEAGTWSTTFTPDASGSHILEFSFWMYQRAGYRIGEYSELKVDVSGGGLAPGEAEYSFRLDGDGGSGQGTGWKTVRVQVDNLEAGQEYTLGFEGSSRAPGSGELTKFRIDDVSLSYSSSGATEVEPAPEPMPEPTPEPAPEPAPEPVPEPAPEPTPTYEPSASLEAIEAEFFALLNDYRAQKLGDEFRLVNDDRLNASAEDWSETMAKSDFFKHSNVYAQVDEYGYDAATAGEICSAGYGGSAQRMFDGFKASSGHNAVMLRTGYEDVGIGHYYLQNDTGSTNWNHYLTVQFGTEVETILI